jgi:FKBP-type peptidyl-prolyl cis-trans isomerase
MFILPTLATRVVSVPAFRNFSTTTAIMGVTKTVTQEGNGPIPQKGQTVAMAYTGWVKDTSKPFNRGDQYVHSPGSPF